MDIRFVSDVLLSVLLRTFLDISPGACADEIHNMSTVHPVKVKAVQNAALMSGHIKQDLESGLHGPVQELQVRTTHILSFLNSVNRYY